MKLEQFIQKNNIKVDDYKFNNLLSYGYSEDIDNIDETWPLQEQKDYLIELLKYEQRFFWDFKKPLRDEEVVKTMGDLIAELQK